MLCHSFFDNFRNIAVDTIFTSIPNLFHTFSDYQLSKPSITNLIPFCDTKWRRLDAVCKLYSFKSEFLDCFMIDHLAVSTAISLVF